jgi:hypothetical protein
MTNHATTLAITAAPTAPPTTPPTIAPVFRLLLEDDGELGEDDAEVWLALVAVAIVEALPVTSGYSATGENSLKDGVRAELRTAGKLRR